MLESLKSSHELPVLRRWAVISELAIDSLMVELGPFFMAARARKKPRSAFFGVEDIVELV